MVVPQHDLAHFSWPLHIPLVGFTIEGYLSRARLRELKLVLSVLFVVHDGLQVIVPLVVLLDREFAVLFLFELHIGLSLSENVDPQQTMVHCLANFESQLLGQVLDSWLLGAGVNEQVAGLLKLLENAVYCG